MKRVVLLLVAAHAVALSTQAFNRVQSVRTDSLVKIVGKVTNEETNEPVSARVFYEKLPYYDDMGTATSNKESGLYQLFMLDNNKYMIEVKAPGFDPIREEITVVSSSGMMEKNFVLSPDAFHKKITLDNLIFARGRALISESSYQELDEFVVWLKARPNAIVQLEGHTDFQGNAQANMRLSQERVDAVKEYLTKKGIKKARIGTKAFGGSQPLTRERTPEARARNRRVEVRILQQ